VDFLVNDLSLHGQFLDLTSFRGAVERLMAIRQIARRFGRALYCHRNIAQALVTPTMRMPQMVQMLRPDERRALLQWLTQQGPFWEDVRHHEPEDWLEWNGNIVTDTAIGEAAWCCLNGIERALVSLMPSNWQFSPVPVDWVWDAGNRKSVDVVNYWDTAAIESVLQTAPVPMASWDQLKALASARCTHLTFTVDAFAPLNGHPFVSGAAQRLLFVLDTLNHFKSCFDVDGQRTPEGHEIYRDYFTGRKGDGGRGPLFTDSSDDEKRTFETEMTFKHPTDANKTLFCPWHGKVQTPQLRVRFSWPVRADEPLYIVYVGPKITKR
jgi:hypothetical protein